MARANWTYIKVDNQLPENEKLSALTRQEVMNLLGTALEVWTYCDRNLTDGHIPEGTWKSLGTISGRRLLLARGFAGPADDGRDGYQCHDYLEHQRSRAEVEETIERNRKAARKRWDRDAHRNAPRNAPRIAGEPGSDAGRNALRNAERNAEHRRAEHIDPSVPTDDLQVEARGTAEPPGKNDDDLSKDPRDDELAGVVQREVRIRTGGGHISDADAAALAVQLLGGRTVRNRAAYLRRVIQDERNPRARFLPAEHPGLAGDLCTFCAQHGHREAECPVKAADEDRPARKATTPGGFQAPSRRPPPDVAKRGAELARELMRQAGDEPDEIPF